MRNTLKNMAEMTYAELTQGRELARLPHTHRLTSLKKKSFLVWKVPLPGSETSSYPGRLRPWSAQNIKQFLSLKGIKSVRKTTEI